jgi:hypothetical protein
LDFMGCSEETDWWMALLEVMGETRQKGLFWSLRMRDFVSEIGTKVRRHQEYYASPRTAWFCRSNLAAAFGHANLY